ncbi:hypothetical protein BCF11_4614 [Collimonas sp. PA-H2]|uniref:hypothetical protein n=1 Tax=Collimonas sp. PA-H2 TaxID=1881062 RepID=UPI000C006ADB|nr:hypothetical protein [Collimonas sp. PA-H2]PFH12139.1 hypothetical protein BCF11_4614 [Collimonas sp. PA-H2]
MHPTVRIFAVFLFAIALLSAALYAIDRPHPPVDGKPPAASRSSASGTADTVAQAAAPAAPAAAAATLAASAPLPLIAAAPPAEAGNTIAKCNVDGKIIYTDKGCPQGSKAKPLQITDNAVIPGYDRATVEKTFRQPPPALAQAAPAGGVIEPVTSISNEPTVDCPALGRRLDWLNGMLHRRQLYYVHDRMRRERDDLQTRMFWAHC